MRLRDLRSEELATQTGEKICALPDLRAVVMTCRSPRSMAQASVLFSDEISIQRSTAFLVVSHFLGLWELPWDTPIYCGQ
jgi:hypothetical protein